VSRGKSKAVAEEQEAGSDPRPLPVMQDFEHPYGFQKIGQDIVRGGTDENHRQN